MQAIAVDNFHNFREIFHLFLSLWHQRRRRPPVSRDSGPSLRESGRDTPSHFWLTAGGSGRRLGRNMAPRHQ